MTNFEGFCVTCKVRCAFNAGSYNSYDDPTTQAGRERKAFVDAHAGHDIRMVNFDYMYTNGDNIHVLGAYGSEGEIEIQNVSEYKEIEPDGTN